MLTELLNTIFTWVTIVACAVTVFSSIGIWYTGTIIDKARKDEINGLHSNIKNLEAQTRDTVFRVSDDIIQLNKDGKYQVTFTLTPDGDKVIPIFMVGVKPTAGSIENLNINGPSIPVMSEGLSKSDDPTWRGVRYTNVIPQKITITINTTLDPQKNPLKIDIIPLAN